MPDNLATTNQPLNPSNNTEPTFQANNQLGLSPTAPQQTTPPSSPYHPLYQPTTGQHIPPPSGKITVQTKNYVPWRAAGKLAVAAILVLGMVLTSIVFGPKIFKSSASEQDAEDILLTTNYKPVVWKDFGNVFEPQIVIPIEYPTEGYQDVEFLLDSGAVVSSLPREEAKKLGLSLAKLPRSTFSGFGGMLSFAYRGKVKALLGTEEKIIPIVFTEAAGTKPLLGRSGFFEQFSVYFNHKDKRIEIRR